MKKVNRRKMDDSAQHNVWRSYSDMMSGMLLLFILIMAVSLMQAQKNYTEKLAEQAKLLQSQSDLQQSQSQVSLQQEQLKEQESELAVQKSTLKEQAASLEQLQALLEQQQASLAEKESEVEAQNSLLTQKESELAISQTKLDDANELMRAQQTRIDNIIGVKAELIADLNEEFKQKQVNVQIDTETGAIVLDASVLFAFNESELVEEGQAILNSVLPVYCRVLLSQEYLDYVAEIIIDGYTDSVGDYASNLALSQARANAVAQFLLGSMEGFLSADEQKQLKEKLTANGRSSSNLILDENGQEDADASRRVEIKFRLKDEEMLKELQEIIQESRSAAAEGGSEDGA